jgi:MOSC domain-containing protein YiiM
MQPTLIGIARRRASRAPMESLQETVISREKGVEGDHRGTSTGRQVTVLAAEAWERACGELGAVVPWTTRRANLLVGGLALESSTGRRVRIGEVVLEITKETAPCARMEEACAGLRAVLLPEWRGGVCCRVIRGGTVHVGDAVAIADADPIDS